MLDRLKKFANAFLKPDERYEQFAKELRGLNTQTRGIETLLDQLATLASQHSKGLIELRNQIEELNSRLDMVQRRLLLTQGAILRRVNSRVSNLLDAEFRIFSQWGEDGIINYLVENLEIANHTFIEFGVEDFGEANCRFLLEDRNWSGFVLDGSLENIQRLNAWGEYWKYSLIARNAHITRENIVALLTESGFDYDLGIMSIDLDGVDYWIAAELRSWHPRILIMEYNAVFGRDRAITIPYSKNFQRTEAHHSNLYWGASLKALVHLTSTWGYALVGSNNAGNNAFFVRRDLLNDRVYEKSLEDVFTDSKYRESRDALGHLNFIAGNARLKEIAGLPVINVETEKAEIL